MTESKVALITGGARGIGLEIGRRLARTGVFTGLIDVNGEEAEFSASQLRASGYQVLAFQADVSNETEVNQVVQNAYQRWERIDILVNNAGICPLTPFLDITSVEWDKVLGINLRGAFLFSHAVVPVMRIQGKGKIINVASSAGQMGGIAVGVHYSASKAAILGFTKSLARILAPDIQVNAVSPGTTESEMTRTWEPAAIQNIVRQIPAGRLGTPVDVAEAVAFLASDEANFITGQTLNVNGGLFMA